MNFKRIIRSLYDFMGFFIVPITVKKKKIAELEKSLKGKFLIATTRGLFFIDNNILYKLINGNCYGITKGNGHVLVYQNTGYKGRIIKLYFDEEYNFDSKTEKTNNDLPKGCHQIDYIGKDLFITDTYNNRILKTEYGTNQKIEFFPLGKLTDGRNSVNYGHINSIYKSPQENCCYLFCHNETLKTGKKSTIIKTDLKFSVIETIETESVNGHNICKIENDLYYCDSENRTLAVNGVSVFKFDEYTRGMSITDEFILIGGSEYKSREERGKSGGMIYAITRDFKEYYSFEFPGPVQEIRRIDGIDYCLSNHKLYHN